MTLNLGHDPAAIAAFLRTLGLTTDTAVEITDGRAVLQFPPGRSATIPELLWNQIKEELNR